MTPNEHEDRPSDRGVDETVADGVSAASMTPADSDGPVSDVGTGSHQGQYDPYLTSGANPFSSVHPTGTGGFPRLQPRQFPPDEPPADLPEMEQLPDPNALPDPGYPVMAGYSQTFPSGAFPSAFPAGASGFSAEHTAYPVEKSGSSSSSSEEEDTSTFRVPASASWQGTAEESSASSSSAAAEPAGPAEPAVNQSGGENADNARPDTAVVPAMSAELAPAPAPSFTAVPRPTYQPHQPSDPYTAPRQPEAAPPLTGQGGQHGQGRQHGQSGQHGQHGQGGQQGAPQPEPGQSGGWQQGGDQASAPTPAPFPAPAPTFSPSPQQQAPAPSTPEPYAPVPQAPASQAPASQAAQSQGFEPQQQGPPPQAPAPQPQAPARQAPGPESYGPPGQDPYGPPGQDPYGPYGQDPAMLAKETAASLTTEMLLHGRQALPTAGWRRTVYRATGGKVRIGESNADLHRRDLINRARTPVAGGHHRVAVMSLKGGVGKTTTAVGLGSTLASLRGDRVIAMDANPDRGTLSDKVRLETAATVRDLLNERAQVTRYADVRAFTSQASSRLEILASDRDPAVSVAFSADDYRAVSRVLEHYYSICITDCGTGLLHSAMSGILELADHIVLVSSPSVDGARSASATLDWLEAHGYTDLVRGGVVVLSTIRPRSKSTVDLDRLEQHFASRCRAVVRLPYDAHLEEGAEFELDLLDSETADAYLELAALVGDGFAVPRRVGTAAPYA